MEEEILEIEEKKIALLLGGGSGLRAGGSLPKQFVLIGGRPLLWWSMHSFLTADPTTRLIVALHADHLETWRRLMEELPAEDRYEHEIVVGGAERIDTVANALAAVKEEGAEADLTLVAIHDGARPLATPILINRGWDCARENGSAVPGVAMTDSVRRLDKAGDLKGGSHAVDRACFVTVQTPQVFRLPLLRAAYAAREPGKTYTDDASLVEQIAPVAIYEGERNNLKVTLAEDFITAERMLGFIHRK